MILTNVRLLALYAQYYLPDRLSFTNHSAEQFDWAIAHERTASSVRMHTGLAIHLPIPFADFRDVFRTSVT